MKKPSGPCEYCHFLNQILTRSASKKDRRRSMARIRLHIKAVHKNPSIASQRRMIMKPPRRTRIARIAVKLAYRLYKTFKNRGVPALLINRIPMDIRPYVVDVLRYNGVAVANPGSDYQKQRAAEIRMMLDLLKGKKLNR